MSEWGWWPVRGQVEVTNYAWHVSFLLLAHFSHRNKYIFPMLKSHLHAASRHKEIAEMLWFWQNFYTAGGTSAINRSDWLDFSYFQPKSTIWKYVEPKKKSLIAIRKVWLALSINLFRMLPKIMETHFIFPIKKMQHVYRYFAICITVHNVVLRSDLLYTFM